MLNKEPLGTMKDYLENTCIIEARNEKIKDNIVFDTIIKDYETLLNKSKEIKKQADDLNEYATSSLMDNYISDYTKKLWMLKQMMTNS